MILSLLLFVDSCVILLCFFGVCMVFRVSFVLVRFVLRFMIVVRIVKLFFIWCLFVVFIL